MAGSSGRLARFKVSDDAGGAGTYTNVGNLQSMQAPRSRNILDDTEFGDSWENVIPGLLSGSFSVSGNRDYADAGQQLIEAAFEDGTELWAQFLYDGTNGRKQQVVVENFEEGAEVNGVIPFSATLRGTGAQAAV